MNPVTKKKYLICLKTAWLVAVVTILLMGMSTGFSSTPACIEAGKFMFFLMFVLSFPASLFSFAFAIALVDPSHIVDPAEFMLVWFIMLVGGLAQWFVIAPNLAGGPEFYDPESGYDFLKVPG